MSDAHPITRNLFMREGSSDKVYNVSLVPQGEAWAVQVVRGRRGATLVTDNKTSAGPVPYDKALAIFAKTVNEKLGKGYQEAAGSTPSPAYTAPALREQTGLVAMLLNEAGEADVTRLLDDPAWCAQEKLDGRRMLIEAAAGAFTAANRRGQTCGVPQDVETGVLALARDVCLDGECIGEVFHAFDLLRLDGADLRAAPYRERLDRLATLHGPTLHGAGQRGWCVPSTASTPDEKRAMLARVRAAGGEGVVFKRMDAAYVPGRPASGGSALKHKFVKTLTAIVTKVNAKRSVALALLDDAGALVDVGKVTVPANQPIPAEGALAEIRYLYANRGGALYQPVLLGIRDDQTRQDCTLRQVRYKSEADGDDAEAPSSPAEADRLEV